MTEIFRDDYMVVRQAQGSRVSIQTGQDPDTATPTIVDGPELVVSLNEYLRSEASDGG